MLILSKFPAWTWLPFQKNPTFSLYLQGKMDKIGVLMICPMFWYLEQELDKRFKLVRFWNIHREFLKENGDSVRAVVVNTTIGADSELIESLPRLEIVSSYSVGLDKIDLGKCREKGIRVTNTPDVLTDDVADLAIGLALATLRKICASDTFVRNGLWNNGDFQLTSKVFYFLCFRLYLSHTQTLTLYYSCFSVNVASF